jgi:hypothetical protein
LTEIAG